MNVDQFLDGGFLAAAESPDEQPSSSSDGESLESADGDDQDHAERVMRGANGTDEIALQEPSTGGKAIFTSVCCLQQRFGHKI